MFVFGFWLMGQCVDRWMNVPKRTDSCGSNLKRRKNSAGYRNENLVLSGIMFDGQCFWYLFFDGNHGGEKIGFLCASNRTQLVVNYFDKE